MPDTPFKFLDAYGKDDASHFYGRTRETARLYNALSAANLVLLYGASGTGKTSLVNCGLANKFYDTDWVPVFIRRGEDISRSITREFTRLLSEQGQAVDLAGLSLNEQVQRLYSAFFRTVYLIFDQFEEFFVLGSREERQAFYRDLAKLLKAQLPAKVLIIIREEYLAYLSEFEKVVPALFDNRLRIEKMNDLNLYRVVAGTAKYAEVELAEPKATIPAIVDNIRNPREGVELAHLQIYLDRLYQQDQRRQQSASEERKVRFDPTLVGQGGQLANIISDFVEEQVKVVSAELKQRGQTRDNLALEILYALVTDDGTKRIMNDGSLRERVQQRTAIDAETVDYCIRRFNELKLIRILPDD